MSKKKEDKKRLLRPRELADRLGLSLSTVYKFAVNGTIPCIRIPGSLVRFLWKDVLEWLEKHHQEGRTNRIPQNILN